MGAANIANSVGSAYIENDRSWALLSFEGTTTSTIEPTLWMDSVTVDAGGSSTESDDGSIPIDDGINSESVLVDKKSTFMEENYDWIVALAVFIGGGVVLNFVCVCLWYRCRDKSCIPCLKRRLDSCSSEMDDTRDGRLFSRDMQHNKRVAIQDDDYEADDDKLPALPEEQTEDNRLIAVSRIH